MPPVVVGCCRRGSGGQPAAVPAAGGVRLHTTVQGATVTFIVGVPGTITLVGEPRSSMLTRQHQQHSGVHPPGQGIACATCVPWHPGARMVLSSASLAYPQCHTDRQLHATFSQVTPVSHQTGAAHQFAPRGVCNACSRRALPPSIHKVGMGVWFVAWFWHTSVGLCLGAGVVGLALCCVQSSGMGVVAVAKVAAR
jgi:hypothetical protein